jgi:hypothetical protein
MIRRRAGRAEDRNRPLDCRQRVKPPRELARDVPYPFGVGRPHVGRLVAEPQQQLLVECLA